MATEEPQQNPQLVAVDTVREQPSHPQEDRSPATIQPETHTQSNSDNNSQNQGDNILYALRTAQGGTGAMPASSTTASGVKLWRLDKRESLREMLEEAAAANSSKE